MDTLLGGDEYVPEIMRDYRQTESQFGWGHGAHNNFQPKPVARVPPQAPPISRVRVLS